jgi:hypothetical protein
MNLEETVLAIAQSQIRTQTALESLAQMQARTQDTISSLDASIKRYIDAADARVRRFDNGKRRPE